MADSRSPATNGINEAAQKIASRRVGSFPAVGIERCERIREFVGLVRFHIVPQQVEQTQQGKQPTARIANGRMLNTFTGTRFRRRILNPIADTELKISGPPASEILWVFTGDGRFGILHAP